MQKLLKKIKFQKFQNNHNNSYKRNQLNFAPRLFSKIVNKRKYRLKIKKLLCCLKLNTPQSQQKKNY